MSRVPRRALTDVQGMALRTTPSAFGRLLPRSRSLQSRIVEILHKPRGEVIGTGYVLSTEPKSLEGGRFVTHSKITVFVFGGVDAPRPSNIPTRDVVSPHVVRLWPEQLRERGRR